MLTGMDRAVFRAYEAAWRLGLPLLQHNRRLADGFDSRILKQPLPAADIWIQAASVGESYLAWEMLKYFRNRNIRILVTTNTRQGMEILGKAASALRDSAGLQIFTAFFPFDRPSFMEKAVAQVRPCVAVLLETEIWPGFLAALRKNHTKILLVNGRISAKSLRGYSRYPFLWPKIRPHRILAVSPEDAARFAILFGAENVSVMSNIKFDRIGPDRTAPEITAGIRAILPDAPFLVLGSVRRAEEEAVEKMIRYIRKKRPDAVIGLFPRHLHRIESWEMRLKNSGADWTRRSGTIAQVRPGTVILWDRFGELGAAYGLAQAVFVGGSLASLGGQNFLEPLVAGTIPVIGPFWKDFQWVGPELFEQGLTRIAQDCREAAAILVHNLEQPENREQLRDAMRQYLAPRQGGTRQACEALEELL